MTTSIDGLFVGKITEHWPGKPPSAIQKNVRSDHLEITPLGLEIDQQADLNVHGGIDKALHHYPADHYVHWQNAGLMPVGTTPAAFGENIATIGLIETNVFIGDIFQFGTSVVQVSQGRQPCWKLNAHLNQPTMAYQFQKTGKTGWYYRVLETGHVQVGDSMTLLERPNPGWSVAVTTAARLTKRIAPEDAATLAMLPELAQGWRDSFAKMAAGTDTENTDARLHGA